MASGQKVKKYKPKWMFVKQRMLNRPKHHSNAAVNAYVKAEYNTFRKEVYCSATLKISDRHREISIDLDFDNLSEYRNCLYKLGILEDVIQGMKDAINKTWEERIKHKESN